MKRLQIAQFIALGATLLSIIGFIIIFAAGNNNGWIVTCIGLVAGIVSYCFGGFLTALKMSWNIAKWGWVVMPFPVDLIAFPFTLLIGLYALFFLPIIPVRKTYRESMA